MVLRSELSDVSRNLVHLLGKAPYTKEMNGFENTFDTAAPIERNKISYRNPEVANR